jgi:hypothetical protein
MMALPTELGGDARGESLGRMRGLRASASCLRTRAKIPASSKTGTPAARVHGRTVHPKPTFSPNVRATHVHDYAPTVDTFATMRPEWLRNGILS